MAGANDGVVKKFMTKDKDMFWLWVEWLGPMMGS
jgi:hypothetical protein